MAPSPLTLEEEVVAELSEDRDQGAVAERGNGRFGRLLDPRVTRCVAEQPVRQAP